MDFSTEDDTAELEAELARLKQEHRDLDTAIEALERMVAGDQLQIQRLKKRKLALKDRITHARGSAHPRHHRLRPAFSCTLREYIARSARAIASSALSFGSRRVDPIEELRGSVRPPSTSGVPRDHRLERSGLLTGRNLVDLPQDHRELVAAEPSDRIRSADIVPDERRDMDEGPVAGFVPVLVVDPLEPVEIREQEADLRAVAGPVGDRPRDVAEEAAAVEEAGQGILLGQGLERGRMGAHVGQLRRKALHFGAQRAELGTDVSCAELAIGMGGGFGLVQS